MNYLAPFLLTHLLVDRLAKARPSRIINTTCHAWRIGKINLDDMNHEKVEKYSSAEMYAQAKLAVVLFTRQMARYLEGKTVIFFSLHDINLMALWKLISNDDLLNCFEAILIR